MCRMGVLRILRRTRRKVGRCLLAQCVIMCGGYLALSSYVLRRTNRATAADYYTTTHMGDTASRIRTAGLHRRDMGGFDVIFPTDGYDMVPRWPDPDTAVVRHCDMNRDISEHYWLCKSLIYPRSTIPDYKFDSEDTTRTSYLLADASCSLNNTYLNCSAVTDTYMFGKDLISEEEVEFPLAFALKVHKSPEQVHRLMRLIYRKHNIYCIHIDSKSPDYMYEHFKSMSRCFDNIIVIEERVNVVYSTIRQIEAEIQCMDVARRSGVKWRYYINLTGQEYMLKTNYEMVRILKLLNGMNDIEGYPVDGAFLSRFGLKTKILRNTRLQTKEKKEIFHRNITLRKGSAYGMFTRKFVEFIRTDSLALEFIYWLNETYAPEEFVWATLNYLPSAPGRFHGDLILSKGFLSRAELWHMDRHKTPCRGKYSRWVCNFGTGDLKWLVKQREIIANKFTELFPLAIHCLEQHMYRITMGYLPEMFDASVYRDAPHIARGGHRRIMF